MLKCMWLIIVVWLKQTTQDFSTDTYQDKTMSKTYTITLTDAQDKALGVEAASQQEWIENVVFERCRQSIELIVTTEIQRKLAAGETISGTKDEIVLAADVESAAEKTARITAEFNARQQAQ